MKEPGTFKEAVTTFEKYYKTWSKSDDYQLKVLFRKEWWGSYKDDGRLATGAIVAIMSVLKDPSISRDLHSLDRPLNTNTEVLPLSISSEARRKISDTIKQKMRTLLQEFNYKKVYSQLFEFKINDSTAHLPEWVREFYFSCMCLLSELIGVLCEE